MALHTAAHVEVELTFEVDASADLPDLELDGVVDSVPEPEHDLVAIYYDTADLRLLQAGITLRRRRGGSDDGWHVKVRAPGATDTRLELRRPPGRSPHPPIAVRRLVRGAARDADLVPVAEIRTHRAERRLTAADGRVLAQLADDLVTSRVLLESGAASDLQPLVWREVEFELVDGDRDLLATVSRVLGASGINESSVQSKLSRALGERVPAVLAGTTEPAGSGEPPTAGAVLREHLGRLRVALTVHDVQVRARQPDGVHQLRVAARRIRSVLAAYRPLLDESRTRPLEDELRWIGLQLSSARDLEVTRSQLRALLDDEPHDRCTRAAERIVRGHLRHASRGAHDEVEAALGSDRYLRTLDRLTDLVRDPPLTAASSRAARGRFRRRVCKAYGRLARRIATAHELQGAERDLALHEARKAAKRLRYAVEVAEPVIGRPARRLRKRTKALQQPLGAHHDGVVLRQLVCTLAMDTGGAGTAAAFALGRLHARIERRTRELDQAALAAWGRTSTPKEVRWLG